MSRQAHEKTPLRVGIFSTVSRAERAIDALRAAGFTPAHITVLCSDHTRQEHFAQYEHQRLGKNTAGVVAAGSAIGATVGGLATLAASIATSGTALLFAGGIAVWSGGVVGALIGAMMTRGVEKELADYYEQSVARGKILVAAESEGPGSAERLTKAEQIFAEIGALPLEIPKG